jgi:hypothetical protein
MQLAALLQLAGVQTGDVVLKDLQLKAEALNALKLPITVKAGFLGSVTLKVQCVFVAQFKAETLCARNCYILSLCDIFQPCYFFQGSQLLLSTGWLVVLSNCGSVQVPWNRLGKDPVIVLLDRIFVLAEPLRDERSFSVCAGIRSMFLF